jgi:hypothetical protein
MDIGWFGLGSILVDWPEGVKNERARRVCLWDSRTLGGNNWASMVSRGQGQVNF